MGIYDRNYYRDDEPSFRPWDRASMVANLIVINAVVLALNFLLTNRDDALSNSLVLRSQDLLQPLQWYRFLTYGFVHADIMHLLFNMLTLYFLGQSVEARYGRWEFLRFYLVTIVLSGVAFGGLRLVMPEMVGGNVRGASGAVVGVVMLFVYNFPQSVIMLWGIVPVKAWLLGILTVLANLAGTSREVAYDVHLAGVACATIYFYAGLNLAFLERLGELPKSFKRRPKLRVIQEDDEPAPTSSRDEQEADRLLDKIYRDGKDSLTAKEQKFLESYSFKIRQKNQR